MCDKCTELDRQIENFQRLYSTTDDKLALALIAEAIAAIKAERASLHPEEQE